MVTILTALASVVDLMLSMVLAAWTWPLSYLASLVGLPAQLPNVILQCFGLAFRFVDVFMDTGVFLTCLKAVIMVELYYLIWRVLWALTKYLIQAFASIF